MKSDVKYKLSTQCKCRISNGQTHRPRSCSRRHLKSSLISRTRWEGPYTTSTVLPLLLHCPGGKLTSSLLLSPHTQGTVSVLSARDTYADILELLCEYPPLKLLPLMVLLVSEKRSDSGPWGASSSRKEEPDTELKAPADKAHLQQGEWTIVIQVTSNEVGKPVQSGSKTGHTCTSEPLDWHKAAHQLFISKKGGALLVLNRPQSMQQ